jgi:hypothetical protein
MEFSPNNNVVKLCLQGMAAEGKGQRKEAASLYSQAWNNATYDFEKFLSAYFFARSQDDVSKKLAWLEKALHIALKINDDTVQSAFPPLYSLISACHQELGDPAQAEKFQKLAAAFDDTPRDQGPFYHGTKADLQIGDLLAAGKNSNYESGLKMNHIYFTALMNGAGLAAELAQGEGRARVYAVEPMVPFENDPNVTNSKFPGNPTRSYRSQAPLKILSEVKEWQKQGSEELDQWRKKLADQKGKIIN